MKLTENSSSRHRLGCKFLIFIPFAISISAERNKRSNVGRKSALLLDFGTFPRIYSSLHRCVSKSFFFQRWANCSSSIQPWIEFNILKANVSRARIIEVDFDFLFSYFSFSFLIGLLGCAVNNRMDRIITRWDIRKIIRSNVIIKTCFQEFTQRSVFLR